MPRKKSTGRQTKPLPANKQKGKKVCTCCHQEKRLVDFYLSYSPMYSLDQRVPVCKECCKSSALNDDGTINYPKFKELLINIAKPLYYDLIESSKQSVKKENSYINDDELEYQGYDILSKYFTMVSMRQNRAKSFLDSEREGFIHTSTNRSSAELLDAVSKYTELFKSDKPDVYSTSKVDVSRAAISAKNEAKDPSSDLIYSKEWMGKYTQADLDRLNQYYDELNNDYKIVTVNHRDYARKIAKASLMMDKAYEDMLKGIPGSDKLYANAKDIFDSLSKSAKFSEDKRSINDVGISSFSKIVSMVENHNWIPEYIPKKKDLYDELLDALRVINKSL